jgi:hypothetical protein
LSFSTQCSLDLAKFCNWANVVGCMWVNQGAWLQYVTLSPSRVVATTDSPLFVVLLPTHFPNIRWKIWPVWWIGFFNYLIIFSVPWFFDLKGHCYGLNKTLSSHLPVFEQSSPRIHSHQLFCVPSVVLTDFFIMPIIM